MIKKLIFAFWVGFVGWGMALGQAAADSFAPSGDGEYCHFAEATSITYANLSPVSTDNGIWYDSGRVHGYGNGYVTTHTILDVADVTYPDSRRYNDVADYVAVPPNTTVEIGFFTHNHTGHSVSVEDSFLFLSRANTDNGDLTRLGASGSYSCKSYLYRGRTVTRCGKMVQTGRLGTWGNVNGSPPPGIVVYSFKTIQPVKVVRQVESVNVSGDRVVINITATVTNNSSYFLSGIQYEDSFCNYQTGFNLRAHSSLVLRYSYTVIGNYNGSIQLPAARVVDNNQHYESVSVGSDTILTFNPENRTIITRRTDSGYDGWLGNQPDLSPNPSGPFIAVRLIPYVVFTPVLSVDLPPQVEVTFDTSDNDEKHAQDTHNVPFEDISYDVCVAIVAGEIDNEHLELVIPVDWIEENNLSVDGLNARIECRSDNCYIIADTGHMHLKDRKCMTVSTSLNDGYGRSQGDYSFIPYVNAHNSFESVKLEVINNVLVTDSIKLEKFVKDNHGLWVDNVENAGTYVEFKLYAKNLSNKARDIVISDDIEELLAIGPVNIVEGSCVIDDNILTWQITRSMPNDEYECVFSLTVDGVPYGRTVKNIAYSGDISSNQVSVSWIDSNVVSKQIQRQDIDIVKSKTSPVVFPVINNVEAASEQVGEIGNSYSLAYTYGARYWLVGLSLFGLGYVIVFRFK